jgi:uncharacterized phage protein (TIGR02220 family)
LRAFIQPTFWSDGFVERLDYQTKYVLLWLITNPQTSIVGLCEVSERRFSFETGLPPEALHRALKALGGVVVVDGEKIFLRTFIKHQWGTGKRLVINNVFKAILSYVDALEKGSLIFKAILESYPEVQKGLEDISEGPESPRDRKGKGKGKEEEVQEEKQAVEVLTHLNATAGSKFTAVDSNLSMIRARLREVKGDVAGVKLMIDRAAKLWIGTEYEEYLRPSTLFGPKKFQERYDKRDDPLPKESNTLRTKAEQLRFAEERVRNHPANRMNPKGRTNPSPEEVEDLRMCIAERDKLKGAA